MNNAPADNRSHANSKMRKLTTFTAIVFICTIHNVSSTKSRSLPSKVKHNIRKMKRDSSTVINHGHSNSVSTVTRYLQQDGSRAHNNDGDQKLRNNNDENDGNSQPSSQNDYYGSSRPNKKNDYYGNSGSSSYGAKSSSYTSGAGDDDWSSNPYSNESNDNHKQKKSIWNLFGLLGNDNSSDEDSGKSSRHSWSLFGGRDDDDYPSSSSSSSSSYGKSYGSSSYGSSSYGSSSYGSSSSSSSSYGKQSNSNSRGRYGESSYSSARKNSKDDVSVASIILLSFLFMITTSCGMLYTAYAFTSFPEGTFANCCRLSLGFTSCFRGILYNLYHCRFAEVVDIICPGEDDEHDFTEEELDRMKLRPGIERALEKEHGKAMKKMEIEMNNLVKDQGTRSWKNAFGFV